MTSHPCAGRSPAAIEVFETIAINGQPPLRPKTIAALLRAGLIEQVGERMIHRDRFGVVMAPVYAVPLRYHYQWCKWCAEQSDPCGLDD